MSKEGEQKDDKGNVPSDEKASIETQKAAPVRSLKNRARNKKKHQAIYKRHLQSRSPQNAASPSNGAASFDHESTPEAPESDEGHQNENPEIATGSKEEETLRSESTDKQSTLENASTPPASPNRPPASKHLVAKSPGTPLKAGTTPAKSDAPMVSRIARAASSPGRRRLSSSSPSRKSDLILKMANRKAITRGMSPARAVASKSESRDEPTSTNASATAAPSAQKEAPQSTINQQAPEPKPKAPTRTASGRLVAHSPGRRQKLRNKWQKERAEKAKEKSDSNQQENKLPPADADQPKVPVIKSQEMATESTTQQETTDSEAQVAQMKIKKPEVAVLKSQEMATESTTEQDPTYSEAQVAQMKIENEAGMQSEPLTQSKVEATCHSENSKETDDNVVLDETEVVKYKDEDPELEDVKSDVSSSVAFDMRSIHDHPPSPPPEPIKEEKAADSTWDTSKALFTEQVDAPTKAANDGLDIFETDSWAVTNTDFSAMNAAHPDIEAVANRLLHEQEKMDMANAVEETTGLHSTSMSSVANSEEEKKEKDSTVEEQVDDPTWDTSNPVFDQCLPTPKKSDDALNMFDTESWGHTDVAFSDVSLSKVAKHADIEEAYLRLVKDDKDIKSQHVEKDKSSAAAGRVTQSTTAAMTSAVEAAEASNSNVAEETNSSGSKSVSQSKKVDETDRIEITEKKFDPKDDVPLLAPETSTGSVGIVKTALCTDDSDALSSGKTMSMEERVKMYTAPSVDDSSVEIDFVAANGEESDDDVVEEVKVDYVEQDSDDEALEDEDVEPTMPEPSPEPVATSEVPTFDAAAVAAERADPLVVKDSTKKASQGGKTEVSGTMPAVEVENLDLIDDVDETSEGQSSTKAADTSVMDSSLISSLVGEQFVGGASVGGNSVATGGAGSLLNRRAAGTLGIPPRGLVLASGAPPPPPPPPANDKKKKRRGKPKSDEKSDIPLIPPPPAEKLKKWEENKMRAHAHIASLKAVRSPDRVTGTTNGSPSAIDTLLKGSSSPVDAARALAIQNALERVGRTDSSSDANASRSSGAEESKTIDEDDEPVEGPPKVMRKAFDNDFDPLPSIELWKDQGIFASENRVRPPKHSGDKTRSPTAGSSILVDQKMAEKVARASSAAAVKFEERFVPCPSSQKSLEEVGEPQDITVTEPDPSMVFCAAPDNVRETIFNVTHTGNPDGQEEADSLYLYGGEPSDKLHDTGLELVGGAFSPWKNPGFKSDVTPHLNTSSKINARENEPKSETERLLWFCKDVLAVDFVLSQSQKDTSLVARLLLEDDVNFNSMCQYLSNCVNKTTTEMGKSGELDDTSATVFSGDETAKTTDSTLDLSFKASSFLKKRPLLKPMVLSESSRELAPAVLAANFVAFLQQVATLAQVSTPFGEKNPFLVDLVDKSLRKEAEVGESASYPSTMQQLIFDHPQGKADVIIGFVYNACKACEAQCLALRDESTNLIVESADEPTSQDRLQAKGEDTNVDSNKVKEQTRRLIVPDEHPSPFESSLFEVPRIVVAVLSFLGDPVAVCRMKMVNRFCRRLISENEQTVMRDAVRAGGLSMNVRPAFWMWITLQKCGRATDDTDESCDLQDCSSKELSRMEKEGREGKWHSVIQRDVSRAFGNMPPHKTGARLRTDSIVRALVTWGRNRIMKRGVKGGGDAVPTPTIGRRDGRKQKGKPRPCTSPPPWETSEDASVKSDISQTPTDTVSDWGGVSPVGSFAGSTSGFTDGDHESRSQANKQSSRQAAVPEEDLALSGNALTEDMKVDLQNKLGFILHALAAAHEDVGYCQGMDYVVAHLLRILQDTVRWKATRGTLPKVIKAASTLPNLTDRNSPTPESIHGEIDKRRLVEETVFRVMDTFFTTYNLRHMYWPELRCLKICCRVFERLIQIKLPVLADHFEHHDLNVGLFALGWFQTLFLYLPSMPSATVCHMWDIWLVERSFKIFFRVGTAILFLSQPILLNHELEGMMTYLNTIPDATLLNPDILIACALNIKVTNRMLTELEAEVTGS